MGQPVACAPPKLGQHTLDALRHELLDVAELMADDQILHIADALHDTLRKRRQLRCRTHQQVEDRLGSGGVTPFPL